MKPMTVPHYVARVYYLELKPPPILWNVHYCYSCPHSNMLNQEKGIKPFCYLVPPLSNNSTQNFIWCFCLQSDKHRGLVPGIRKQLSQSWTPAESSSFPTCMSLYKLTIPTGYMYLLHTMKGKNEPKTR